MVNFLPLRKKGKERKKKEKEKHNQTDSPTHWKQVMFFVKGGGKLEQDQIVSGKIRITKNARNPRCIDVSLSYSVEGWQSEESNTYSISDDPLKDAKKKKEIF